MDLQSLHLDSDLFVNKIKQDLSVGVEINSLNMENTKLVRVWTDSQGWEFLVIGLLKENDISSIFAAEIHSQGVSKNLIKMTIDLKIPTEPRIDFEKMANTFGGVGALETTEAEEFTQAYITSTFNRTKTGDLFNELASDKNYFNWLIY